MSEETVVSKDNLEWNIIDDSTLGLILHDENGKEHAFLLRRPEIVGLRNWFDQWIADTSVETILGLEGDDMGGEAVWGI